MQTLETTRLAPPTAEEVCAALADLAARAPSPVMRAFWLRALTVAQVHGADPERLAAILATPLIDSNGNPLHPEESK